MNKQFFGRIAKFIAEAGVCSRREAEKLIEQGRVKLGGQMVTTPALNVNLDDVVEVDGKVIKPSEKPRLWLYYKPVGLITTHHDPQNRPTVFETLKHALPRVISVGRLDINSEGLLLLTNNGELARNFELPKNKIERVYKVRAYGNISNLLKYFSETNSIRPLSKLANGEQLLGAYGTQNHSVVDLHEDSSTGATTQLPSVVEFGKRSIIIKDVTYNVQKIKLISENKANCWCEVTLTEGKNREIRKIFEYFALEVNRLIRIKYGNYKLGNLKPGEFQEVALKNKSDN